MAKTEIPADRPLYSRGFVIDRRAQRAVLKGILEEAAAGKLPAGTPFAKQMGDDYATCTDEAGLEKSLPEVKKFIASVTALKNAKDLAKAAGHPARRGLPPVLRRRRRCRTSRTPPR